MYLFILMENDTRRKKSICVCYRYLANDQRLRNLKPHPFVPAQFSIQKSGLMCRHSLLGFYEADTRHPPHCVAFWKLEGKNFCPNLAELMAEFCSMWLWDWGFCFLSGCQLGTDLAPRKCQIPWHSPELQSSGKTSFSPHSSHTCWSFLPGSA